MQPGAEKVSFTPARPLRAVVATHSEPGGRRRRQPHTHQRPRLPWRRARRARPGSHTQAGRCVPRRTNMPQTYTRRETPSSARQGTHTGGTSAAHTSTPGFRTSVLPTARTLSVFGAAWCVVLREGSPSALMRVLGSRACCSAASPAGRVPLAGITSVPRWVWAEGLRASPGSQGRTCPRGTEEPGSPSPGVVTAKAAGPIVTVT